MMLFSRNKLDMANIEGSIILPLRVDKTPNGEIVKRAHIGEPGYGENVEFNMQITHVSDCIVISYYGEDNTFLSESDFKKLIKFANE